MTLRSPEWHESIEFDRLLLKQDVAGLNRMIDANPALLCHINFNGDLPLNEALWRHLRISAQTILDALQKWKEVLRAGPLPKNVAMDEGNPLYLHGIFFNGRQWGQGYPHEAAAFSAQELAFLAENGYDLNHGSRKSSLLRRLLRDYSKLGLNDPHLLGSPLAVLDQREALLAAAVKHGLNVHRDVFDRESEFGASTNHHAVGEILAMLGPGSVELVKRKFSFLASLGMDIRDYTDLKKLEISILAATSAGGQASPWAMYAKPILDHLKRRVHEAGKQFVQGQTPEERNTPLLTLCASGALPSFLRWIATHGKQKTYEKILSGLDDFWRAEYRHTLSSAGATLARTAPVEESALSGYARGGVA